MHQNAFGGRASPGPAGELTALSDPLAVFRRGAGPRKGKGMGRGIGRGKEEGKGRGNKWERGGGREGREGSVPLQFLPVPPTF